MGILSYLFGKKEKRRDISKAKMKRSRKFYNNCPICRNKKFELVEQSSDDTHGFREYRCNRCKCIFRTVERDDADYIVSIRRMVFKKIRRRHYFNNKSVRKWRMQEHRREKRRYYTD